MLSERTIKCPVCNSKAKQEEYSSSWGTEEEYITCPVYNYHYQFAYGNYFEEVGNKWFIWDYTMNPKTHPRLFKKMKQAMFMARRRWKKHKKGCKANNCPL